MGKHSKHRSEPQPGVSAPRTLDTQGYAPGLSADKLAHLAVRSLLAGGHPDDYAATPMASFGPWAHIVKLLFEAHAAGGTDALVRAYTAITRMDEPFALLMTCDRQERRTAFKLRELVTADYPPPRFIVPGLLPTGLSILAGRPKLGKSWLALQIAIAADTGGCVLGIQVPKTKVLYLALEDTEHRLSDRIKKLTANRQIDWDSCGDALFHTAWSPFSERGLSDLREAFDRGCKLIIVDTLSRALGDVDQMDTADMTRMLGALQRLALDHGAALLLVDHHRKSARTSLDADPIDDILGSTAKGGVVDCALGLYRRHNENEATLKITGRDFGDSDLCLQWDPDCVTWSAKPQQPDAKHRLTLREREAVDAVCELRHATLTELVAHLRQDKSNLYTRLQNLCSRGVLACRRCDKGYEYTPAPQQGEVAAAHRESASAKVVAVVPVVEAISAENDVQQPTTTTTEAVTLCDSGAASAAPVSPSTSCAEARTPPTVVDVVDAVDTISPCNSPQPPTTTTTGDFNDLQRPAGPQQP